MYNFKQKETAPKGTYVPFGAVSFCEILSLKIGYRSEENKKSELWFCLAYKISDSKLYM